MRAGIFSAAAVLVALCLAPSPAAAQTPAPSRDEGWGTATTITATAALGLEVVLPRVFYTDPEATVGWKARWHVSALAPVLTVTGVGLFNEFVLKDAIEGYRPGCDSSNQGGTNCESFGMMSTHSFLGFGALGNGIGVFLFDTTKWSDGRFNVGSFVGHVGVPLVLSVITAVGRGVGDYEDTPQILVGGGAGLVTGFLTGAMFSLMQRPECGYTGSLICW